MFSRISLNERSVSLLASVFSASSSSPSSDAHATVSSSSERVSRSVGWEERGIAGGQTRGGPLVHAWRSGIAGLEVDHDESAVAVVLAVDGREVLTRSAAEAKWASRRQRVPSRAAGRLRPSREVRTPSPVVGLSGLSTTASTGIAEPGFGSGRSHAASVRCSATTSGVSAASGRTSIACHD